MKRLLALLLVLTMLPLPTVFAAPARPTASEVIPEAAYDAVTADVWDDIEALEQKEIVSVRGKKADFKDYAALTDEVAHIVEASDTYEEGTLNSNGDFLTWQTTDGIACCYSPALRARANATGADPEEFSGVETVSYATRSGSPTSCDVAVFQPYYGIDSSFKKTYQTEGQRIAQALGGTSTTYKTNDATIDAIADAMESCAVVIFDSHGDTDYANPRVEDDFVSKANTSYLCLQSGAGITEADMKEVTGTFDTYYHALYGGSSGTMKYYLVDGTAIANHMEKSAPNSLLWMAICLGMATDGMQAPLRAKGVEVVYGYSQSISFDGDYDYEKTFWDSMIAGKDVAAAAKAMKDKHGLFDPGYANYYSTVSQAQRNYIAFPYVVSLQDTYPGHGNVDALQIVKSNWLLKATTPCDHAETKAEHKDATCTETGYDRMVCSACGATVSETIISALGHDYTSQTVEPTCSEKGYTLDTCSRCNDTQKKNYTNALGHDYKTEIVLATCTEEGYTLYICNRCEDTQKKNIVAALGHDFMDGVCTRCDAIDPDYVPACTHENVTTEHKNATCTEAGYDKQTCKDCGQVIADTAISALGHEIQSVVTKPTCTEQGYTTYTCTRCKQTEQKDFTAPDGHTVEDGVCVICGWKEPLCYDDFSDLEPEVWYRESVTYVLENGIMNGVDKGVFDPEGHLTRAMLVTILYRQEGCPSVEGMRNLFEDVPTNEWYTAAVIWAASRGIVNGTSETTFEPDEPITREQIAVILFRYALNKGAIYEETTALLPFPDIQDISLYARDAMSWCVENGIIGGSDGYLLPLHNATRAECAKMLFVFVSII